ncbi:hypothetical protein [Streptomyces sp. NBC_00582]|uniref:hypothetical protein n=1 Tax=Streptomyces sp. NBC_00582 TaxID=2975783 RepID=UPI002E815FAA|nr:hypothetical protein [Streptomyces sp. NBC_00582]WUB61507.1 hypothetical protein OG852_14460 [Streptomyces sp. NBC_00582]
MTRADRRTLVRQLHEQGLSRRAIGERLGVGKDTVRRDLDAIKRQDECESAPPAAPAAPETPQASDGATGESAPQDAPPAEDARADEQGAAAPGAPVARLPRRIPVDSRLTLDVDLSKRHALRRALADLAVTGLSLEELVGQGLVVLALAHRQGVAAQRISPQGRFTVLGARAVPSQPGYAVPRRPQPAASAEGV